MPLLRTTEKIFIGYSIPQLEHKETVERVINDVNAGQRHKHIQLYVCEYRGMVNSWTPLQTGIDEMIAGCDLVILLFGSTVGPGLAWEAQHTFELFKTGRVYQILPYVFSDGSASSRQTPGGLGSATDVEVFYNERGLTYYKIERPDTFEERLRTHIERWLAEEERIVERQRDFLRRGLLRHFAIEDPAFDDQIMAVHRRDQDQLGATADTAIAYRNYVDSTDAMIQEEPIHYYLIARHLRDAVLNNRPELLAKAEFINPIHQFLAALLRLDGDDTRARVIMRYEQWLSAKVNIAERTRSFAAFQLGMLQAREAAPVLLQTARNRGELRSVRHYAIYSLGMLKQRSLIIPLMDVHADEADNVIRDALTNSILFMTGVTE